MPAHWENRTQGYGWTGVMTKAKGPEPPCSKRAVPATKTNPTTGAFQISDDRFHRLHPQPGRRDSGHQMGGWVQSQALGGGTHPQLAEPIPTHLGALGEVPRELHRLPSFRLRPHRPQSRRVIRIGSKPPTTLATKERGRLHGRPRSALQSLRTPLCRPEHQARIVRVQLVNWCRTAYGRSK